MAYPYSAHLHLLLLLKARTEDHVHQELILQKLASRTFDREHLYDLLRELEREEQAGEAGAEERLELPELDKLDLEFAVNPTTPQSETPAPVAPVAPVTPLAREAAPTWEEPATSSVKIIQEDDAEENGDVPQAPLLEPTPPPYAPPARLLADIVALAELIPLRPDPKPAKLTEPTEPNAAAPSSNDALKNRLRRHRKKQLKRLRHQKADRIKEIARQSVRPQDETVSETLAKLLTHQEQYARAIKMYEKLILLNPEKKAIFAARIQELKEKIITP